MSLSRSGTKPSPRPLTRDTHSPGAARAVGPDPDGIPQYSRSMVLLVWAAATVPMGLLAWVIAPAVAGHGAPEQRFAVTLLSAMTVGLAWQSLMVVILMMREHKDGSWTTLRDRLWIKAPHTATRRGGRLWWWVAVYALALAVLDLVPVGPMGPEDRDLGAFLGSAAGQHAFHHAWGLYALVALEAVLNTVIGEELLFRGVLLPRMKGAFGRADWVVNGVLFGLYHVHEPWIIPNAVLTGFLCAGPSKKFRSSLMGMAIHSVESAFFLIVLLPVVLR
jgi:uncharacterized protein